MSKFQSPYPIVDRIRVIFYAMTALTLPLFLYTYSQSKQGNYHPPFEDLSDTFLWVLAAICVINAVIAYIIYQKNITEHRKLPTLSDKLHILLKSNIKKFIQMEITTVMAAVVYLLNGTEAAAGVYIIAIILFAMSNPTIYSIIGDLKLPKDQVHQLKKDIPFDQAESAE
ncbi:hypothetical protein [Sediminitomix flava]|uniref:Uncharacterized protein n=1 Tax=Sediminitomix flava TaxID=379075 RepID=A0A315Z7T4_SEDFL|nr:hypothetical protein [Sediminitomix flava]PWJ39985.1 hypothetical protein BC781_10548 [Sediminitomix flava]